MSRALLAQVLIERGVFNEALAVAAEGIRLGEALDHVYSINMARWTLAYAFLVKGEVSRAIEVCERGITVAQQRNVASGVPWLTASLGFAYALAGRAADGLRLLRDAHEARRFAGLHSLFTIHLTETYLMNGQVEAARSIGTEALMLTQQRGERGYQAWALRAAGDIASAEDPVDFVTAERRYQESATLATERGMCPLVAHCHLGLGKLYRRMGKREQALEHLTTARTMYRDMGMRHWLEPSEAETRELV
jgi:tetratricopeptide (TPR) repeat protein